MELKHFTLSEFDSPDEPGSGQKMNESFLHHLDLAREAYGAPMRITSGYRSEEHNRKVGGAAKSSHLTGHAADISAPTGKDKAKILVALFDAGFRRFGIMRTAIHVDNDPSKPPAVWHYPNTREEDRFEFSNLADIEMYSKFYKLNKSFK